MASKPTNLKSRCSGFTLVELLIATGLGMILLLGLASFYSFSVSSFASMSNYVEMSNQSRNANDIISRDLRLASSVISASTNQTSSTTNRIVLGPADSANPITYTFDPTAQTLSRTQGGTSQTLLKGVGSCIFSLYQRPTNSAALYEQFPPGVPANAKLVAFQWSCIRRVVTTQIDSETIQTAMVSLRNQ
jgi:Tfp pilus assembly protein PilW